MIQNPATLAQDIIRFSTDNDAAAEGEILDVAGNNLAGNDFVL